MKSLKTIKIVLILNLSIMLMYQKPYINAAPIQGDEVSATTPEIEAVTCDNTTEGTATTSKALSANRFVAEDNQEHKTPVESSSSYETTTTSPVSVDAEKTSKAPTVKRFDAELDVKTFNFRENEENKEHFESLAGSPTASATDVSETTSKAPIVKRFDAAENQKHEAHVDSSSSSQTAPTSSVSADAETTSKAPTVNTFDGEINQENKEHVDSASSSATVGIETTSKAPIVKRCHAEENQEHKSDVEFSLSFQTAATPPVSVDAENTSKAPTVKRFDAELAVKTFNVRENEENKEHVESSAGSPTASATDVSEKISKGTIVKRFDSAENQMRSKGNVKSLSSFQTATDSTVLAATETTTNRFIVKRFDAVDAAKDESAKSADASPSPVAAYTASPADSAKSTFTTDLDFLETVEDSIIRGIPDVDLMM